MPDENAVDIESFIAGFFAGNPEFAGAINPWAVLPLIAEAIDLRGRGAPGGNYDVDDGVFVHRDAIVEPGAVIKSPALLMAGAFVAANAYLRGGVILGCKTRIGPGCEVKSSVIGDSTTLAHFNYVGDSLVGLNVNLEAGAVVANHFNERKDKRIFVYCDGHLIDTGTTRFGALIGDSCRIGANAVLSPGTLLPQGSIVGRLELIGPAVS